jgi:hypothetical protein
MEEFEIKYRLYSQIRIDNILFNALVVRYRRMIDRALVETDVTIVQDYKTVLRSFDTMLEMFQNVDF